MKVRLEHLTKRFPNSNRKIKTEVTAVDDVTLEIPDGQLADCLSTALFVRGEREALKYWRSSHAFEMVLITNDWRMVVTDGLYSAFHSNTDSYTISFVK